MVHIKLIGIYVEIIKYQQPGRDILLKQMILTCMKIKEPVKYGLNHTGPIFLS